MTQRYISWFSCGAASATATKLALQEYDNVRIVYQDTSSEHPDNVRFRRECEQWFGQEVEVHKSDKYDDIWDVFEKTRYLAGVGGARCTGELKRKVAESIIDWGPDQQIEVFGYTVEEEHRVKRFIEQNNERRIAPILVERGLTKQDCLGFIDRAGIAMPVLYTQGFSNNNCLGCPKGQQGYWRRIKKYYPDVYARMSAVERELDVAVNKRYEGKERIRVFLDELGPGPMNDSVEIQCGLICMSEHDAMDDFAEANAGNG